MELTFYILSFLLALGSSLPFISDQHWMFRVWDFGRIQITILLLILIATGWLFVMHHGVAFYICQSTLMLFVLLNTSILIPYTRFFPRRKPEEKKAGQKSIKIISVNVYQFNQNYDQLIDLVREREPDVLITMESNSDWEQALRVLEDRLDHTHKCTLENTYGMHFYTCLDLVDAKTHFLVSDDVPSFELELKDYDGRNFRLFGVHPPPPSPTEEETSKERDGELLSVAKLVKEKTMPTVVVGDFNNVAWARSSVLFRKTSRLCDPRRGYGLVSTFHAKYRLFRFPIDLFFHSDEIYIETFKADKSINSDHLPLYSEFYITDKAGKQEGQDEELTADEKEEVEEKIKDGKVENGERAAVAEE